MVIVYAHLLVYVYIQNTLYIPVLHQLKFRFWALYIYTTYLHIYVYNDKVNGGIFFVFAYFQKMNILLHILTTKT